MYICDQFAKIERDLKQKEIKVDAGKNGCC